MRKKQKTEITNGLCCRYHWQVVKGSSVSEFMIYNIDEFNKSWNVFSFYKEASLKPVYKGHHTSWFADGMIVFNSMVHQFNVWRKRVNWDAVGAWYFYSVPTTLDKKELEPLYLQEHKIPLLNRDGCEAYFRLPIEWEFIHHLKPDLAVIKQSNDTILVIGLDKHRINELVLNLPWNPNHEDPF